jgi:arginase family enzyme
MDTRLNPSCKNASISKKASAASRQPEKRTCRDLPLDDHPLGGIASTVASVVCTARAVFCFKCCQLGKIMDIQIIQVPYDSGHEAVRTGRGPAYLVDQGVVHRLLNDGHRVQVSRVQSDLPLPTENGTTFDILRHIARHVQSAVQQSRHPIILAGNCNSCVGTLAGLDTERLGIVWLDAHGDFNTPETTTTGFLDGMGLAMASGRCWRALLATIPGFSPVADNCIIHVGSRDLDDAEKLLRFKPPAVRVVLTPAQRRLS